MATIQGWHSELQIGGLLFEGDYYSRGTTIRGGLLFEGDYYSRGTTIRGGLLFKADYYSRAAFISSESPRTSTMAGQGTYE